MTKQLEIEWVDEPLAIDDADEPLWAVWESLCRGYRIDYDGRADTYTPKVFRVFGSFGGGTTGRTYEPLTPQPSLAGAMQAINEYHCDKYNLKLVGA